MTAAVSPCFFYNHAGINLFNPLTNRHSEMIESGLLFNSLEFDGIKIRIIYLFSDSRKLNSISFIQTARLSETQEVSRRNTPEELSPQ